MTTNELKKVLELIIKDSDKKHNTDFRSGANVAYKSILHLLNK